MDNETVIDTEPIDEEKDFEELWTESGYEFLLWQRFIKLPYYIPWMYMILIIAYVETCQSVYRVFLKDTDETINEILENRSYWANVGNVFYFVDVTLILVCQKVSGFVVSPIEIRYPIWMLTLELLSTLPLHLIIPEKPLNPLGLTFYYFFQLKDCLKGFRIINVFRYFQNLIQTQKVLILLLEYVCYLHVGAVIVVSLTFQAAADFRKALYISVIRVTNYGYMIYPTDVVWMGCVVVVELIAFALVSYAKALIIWTITETNIEGCKFLNIYHLILHDLAIFRISEDLSRSIRQYYQICWNTHNIFIQNWKRLYVLPPSMNEELSIEINWFAFKHSKLFRKFSLPFLRSLSMSVRSEMRISGEILFKKGDIKNKMIYVESGVIQILSEEDDKSPIFSFSGGTCLGEFTLMLFYKSSTTVRCKTTCRLHVLYQTDFVKATRKNRKEFMELRDILFERLAQAKKNRALSAKISEEYDNERTNYITVMWLKNTLHRLMSKDEATIEKHLFSNIFLRNEFDEDTFKDRHFIGDYLDLLAISERLELVTDTLFLKSSCPCILQPISVFLTFWNWIVAILACSAGLVLPYFAFFGVKIAVWYTLYIAFITVVWWIDLYVQLSTSIKTRDKIISSIVDIFEYRMTTLSFLLDVAAAVPLEMFSSIVLWNASPNYIVLIGTNRIIKIQRLYEIYKNWRNKITSKSVFITWCWYQLCYLYITYVLSSLLYYLKYSEESPLRAMHKWYIINIFQILNGSSFSNPFSKDEEFFVFYIFTCIIAIVVELISFTSLNSIYCMVALDAIKAADLYRNTADWLNFNRTLEKFKKRIRRNTEALLFGTGGHLLLYGTNAYEHLPWSIYSKLTEELYGTLLRALPFFQDLPDELLAQVAVHCDGFIVPANEVLCSTGQISDSFMFLERGFCNVVSSKTKRFLKGPCELALLETYTCSPVIDTIVTVSHCRVVKISYVDCIQVLQQCPQEKRLIDSAISDLNVINNLSTLYQLTCDRLMIDFSPQAITKTSFKNFGYNLPEDSFVEYDYYVPFDRLQYFSFVQYFLMRFTILPNGKFLLAWEGIRCLCAAISAIVFPLISVNENFRILMLCLDGMAWADIYLRFHVCYYNKNGLLVSHPLTTAEHYLKHAFLIDLLGVLPLQLLVETDNPERVTKFQLNRVLQMYRYLGIARIIFKEQKLSSFLLLLVKYFPIVVTGSFFLSFFVVTCLCSVTSSAKVECADDSWMTANQFVDPLEPFKLQMYGIYLISSVLTQSAMQGFEVNSTDSALSIVVLTVMKNVLMFILVCETVQMYTTRVSTLWKYQKSMWGMINYMKKNKIKANLQNELITHFEVKWFRFGEQNVSAAIAKFHDAFKQDILYEMYGKVFENSSIFSFDTDTKHFFRSLFLQVEHDMVIKNGIALKMNDVSDSLSFVYKGIAAVFGADGVQIATLNPGSMFGNLIETERSRQTVTIQAVRHIEVLIVKTNIFYKTLKKYSRLYHYFKDVLGYHVDFLENESHWFGDDRTRYSMFSVSRTNLNFRKAIVFNPESACLKIWNVSILIVVCYLEAGFTLYQIALREYNWTLIAFQYLCDAMYLVNYCIKRRTGFENENGVIVYDLKAIKQNLYKNKLMAYLELIVLVPLDVVAWIVPRPYFYAVHSVLRLNRPFRVLFFFEYLKECGQRLSSFSVTTWTFRLLLSTVYILHICSTTTIIVACSGPDRMQPSCDVSAFSTSSQRLDAYVTYLYIIASVFTGTAQSQYYPTSSVVILYFALLMVFAAILRVSVLGRMYAIVQMHYNERIKYRRIFEIIKGNVDQENVSPALHRKFINYLQFLWRSERGVVTPRLLRKAPQCLREAILNDAFAHHINQNAVFAKCHPDFKRQLASSFTSEVFFQGDYVVFSGTINGCMYFIHSGSVEVKGKKHRKQWKLKKGSCFGIAQGIFADKPYLHSFQALKTTTVLTLDFDNWKHLLDFFPASQTTILEQYMQYDDPFV